MPCQTGTEIANLFIFRPSYNLSYGSPRHSPIMDTYSADTTTHTTTNAASSTYIPPSRSSDPECVNVAELLANWLAPEVRLLYGPYSLCPMLDGHPVGFSHLVRLVCHLIVHCPCNSS